MAFRRFREPTTTASFHDRRGLIPSRCPDGKETRTGEAATRIRFAGVLEIIEGSRGDTYRAVYTVRFAAAVFVLPAFQKKAKSGIGTPKQDMESIRERLKVAEQVAKEL